MLATMTIIIGLTTLVLTAVLLYAGVFNIIFVGVLVVAINVIEWLFAPYLLGAVYHIRKIAPTENAQLHQIVNNLSKKCGISTPQLMLAQIPVPNAFAYGSPISGSRVAVTPGLLTTLNTDEVEAVLGHELGHLRHKDVQVMMAVSCLPSVFMFLGYSLMWSGSASSSGGRAKSGGGNGNGAIIGIALMAFSYLLTFFTLWLSRIREYYADRNSVQVVDNGAWKLSTALAKISNWKKPMKGQGNGVSAFKCLFITDPGNTSQVSSNLDASYMVQALMNKKLTTGDKVAEAFSTHPNMTKRLRALYQLNQNPNA